MRSLLIIYNEIYPCQFNTLFKIYLIIKENINIKENLQQLLGSKVYKELIEKLNSNEYQTIQSAYHQQNIKIITAFDKLYPMQLFYMSVPPVVLYAQGDMQLLQNDQTCSFLCCNHYSKNSFMLTKEIVQTNHFLIVGTLTSDIYQEVYELIFKEGGNCINILATSMIECFPVKMRFLQKKLNTNQLNISEIPLSAKHVKNYLMRCREVMCYFSKYILLLEEDTNYYNLAIITHLVNMGKDIFVVPHHLFYKQGIVNNLLLKDGANIYISPNDLT